MVKKRRQTLNKPLAKTSQRTCLVTRNTDDPENLVRFVLSPGGLVVPDLKRKLPGRGVWLSPHRAVVEKAAARGLFARGFKQPCKAPEDLADQVDRLLESACLGYLSLANKAGCAIRGFDKVANAISRGRIKVLIAASDGASDGIGKLERQCRSANCGAEMVSLFDSSQLDLALGGTNVIHAAITQGVLAEKFSASARKLARYRGNE